MVYIDGVIYALQQGGGISVVFDELIRRMPDGSFSLNVPKLARPWQRYMSVECSNPSAVFHSTYYRLPAGRTKGVITTVHDFTYERFVKGPSQWVHSWQKTKAVQGADIIVCISENTKSDLLRYISVRETQKIVVIPNGVSETYVRLDLAVKSQVLFVGARGGYKNFGALVKALADIPGLGLLCVGGGAFTSDECAAIERYIPGRCQHAGRITNEQLNVCYNESLCLVYPSLYEGFGIPVLEAMRAGCPVVAVNSSSIPEVAGDAALLMEQGQVEEIRACIHYFLSPDNRLAYIERGLRQAENFSWDHTFVQMRRVYEDLLGAKL